MNNRQLFLQHVAQTSDAPLALEIVKAEGMYMWDVNGKRYLDLIAGISVCNVGHCHPAVVKAIQEQAQQYMHLLVYGEFVQSPQVAFASLLTQHLPEQLNCVYFTNSGAEAVEGAMKLAKRYTGRPEIAAFNRSYHGSTQGALSILGDEYWRNAYRPLLPGIQHLEYNNFESLELITERTAAVIAESVQAEGGVIAPQREWLHALRNKCSATGALLILDEIQCGFGRNGTLWAFEQFGIVPDVLLLGKALGGGMPLGAFIASREIMWTLTNNPVLGHITTFGGHPVNCAAGRAGFQALLDQDLLKDVNAKGQLFLDHLKHPAIKSVRSLGLMIAVEFESFPVNKKVIDYCIDKGVLTDWFLFAAECMRIVPPLIITPEEIKWACSVICEAADNI
ncbi:aspartate aminotransferase family protein [Chitinophaga ginsengisegetis]|uniref:aspartate aminotransferase family protein n=1 Tax=Chitinophaga ginsengisegetis TaxID=393003 RepID=UPI000DB9D844|nr:aminotransferase class III-fold pyridoxal phosphate-dependent enzyme [Chitinophaga ginsengisegetis]MDR6565872.1 acetylornithine/succinyldiaminopimelate/putrescine aminotransferase [Chitinophaga ginsengisegetis]MDR6645601.1 acetylornithine/succinyldiaminopimelate/putrescine aminotransferase [Chitinophaga ginsengisegetis]MDR6651807.1 acetylornithine/succinyldiaminopimelate/putrescine aminotransferase [Chitinophaga ginsengisegetis]